MQLSRGNLAVSSRWHRSCSYWIDDASVAPGYNRKHLIPTKFHTVGKGWQMFINGCNQLTGYTTIILWTTRTRSLAESLFLDLDVE